MSSWADFGETEKEKAKNLVIIYFPLICHLVMSLSSKKKKYQNCLYP